MLLNLKNVSVGYNKRLVLQNVDIGVNEGEINCVIGANGAGKSTLLSLIDGTLYCASGSINFNDEEITHLSIFERIKRGVVHVPEGRQIFAPLTVYENLLLGTYGRRREVRTKEQELFSFIFDVFPILAERRKQIAGTLSGGEQQMLAIARGLMSDPKLMLIDEPSLGLAPILVRRLGTVFSALIQHGVTLLIVEQNASIALEISDYVYLLNLGIIVAHGKPAELQDRKEIKKFYLGI